ncbi:Alpha/Beta hydrolase protein [Clohesyomyces aquaticus]|uniref:Feruloyl esterase C n=1 Tax=Clohesyomyces aquaticus TaxID=1231657 RepID=A0A1Y1ZRZ5_9PLEO|nr:Alpha/Beta hydrolase protein [Clohesyomyces aquaticus]
MRSLTSLAVALLAGASSVLALPGQAFERSIEDAATTSLNTAKILPRANSAGCGKTPTITSGTKSITVNGKSRQYTIRVPTGYDKSKPYKLIFAFHWVGGTMGDVSSGGSDGALWAYYGMQKMAQESAILVAPQGISNGWGNSGGEDISFVDAMRSAVESDLCVNQAQRFALGFSYGGSMSYSIACSRAKDFRAVVVISGGVLSGCSGGNDPIAYMGIHGINDGTLNISGGRSMRDRFVANNGCTKQNPKEPAAGSRSHVTTEYSGCKAGYPVTWLAFDGGHAPAPVDGGSDSGAKSYTPTEMWKFFSQFS